MGGVGMRPPSVEEHGLGGGGHAMGSGGSSEAGPRRAEAWLAGGVLPRLEGAGGMPSHADPGCSRLPPAAGECSSARFRARAEAWGSPAPASLAMSWPGRLLLLLLLRHRMT